MFVIVKTSIPNQPRNIIQSTNWNVQLVKRDVLRNGSTKSITVATKSNTGLDGMIAVFAGHNERLKSDGYIP